PAHPRMSRSPPDRRALRSAVVGYRFSAFWLRSSVVSVLISLISDTSSTRGLYIKWIFGTGSRKRGLLRPLHALTRYCSAAGNGALLSLSKNRIHSQEALALPRAENFAPPALCPVCSPLGPPVSFPSFIIYLNK